MVASPRLESPALAALRNSPIPPLRKLSLEETDGEVVICGSVPTYYMKQLAQEALMATLQGRHLRNLVRVDGD